MNEIIANFLDIVKGKYAKFDGRARRKEYWNFVLFYLIAYIALAIIATIFANIAAVLGLIVYIILMVFCLGLLVPMIALGVRRMHDVGKSGWFLIIPLYNLILALTEGERKDNEYGPDPKKSEKLV